MSNQDHHIIQDLNHLQSKEHDPDDDSYESNDHDTTVSPPWKTMLPPVTPPPSSPRQDCHDQRSLMSPSSPPRPPSPPPHAPAAGYNKIGTPPQFFHNHDDLMMALEVPFTPYLPYGQPSQPHMQTWPGGGGGYNMQYIKRPSSRPWSTGPCDIFSDIKNSFITLFCACFTFGQIAEIINEGKTSWWENALIYFVLEGTTVGVATSLYVALYRVKMRERFSLNGTFLWDVLFSIVCTRLSLCQQYRQLDRLGFLVPLGWEANMEKQRRIAMESMFIHHQFVAPVVEPGMHR